MYVQFLVGLHDVNGSPELATARVVAALNREFDPDYLSDINVQLIHTSPDDQEHRKMLRELNGEPE